MKVFIAGASGLLGGNCMKVFKTEGWEVKGSHLSFPTADTVFYNTLETDHPDNFDLMSYKPDVIVHCGALTHVDYCEAHPEESYEKTVTSTKNLVTIAQSIGARLVYISTDYVFDGTAGPYTEDAPVNPLCIYGKHKLEAERFVLSELKDALVLRITNVYGDEIRGRTSSTSIIDQCRKGKNCH